MRQRTTLTPDECEQEESVGIPTTIEWAADEVSVEEEPRIPLKIEVMKVRAPSSRNGSRGSMSGGRRRSIPVEEETDDSGRSESTRKLRYDDFLYGDGSMPSPPANLLNLKLDMEQDEQEEEEEEEHDALAAMGSFLVAGAMQACQHEQDEELDSKDIQISSRSCPVRRAPPTTRRSSRQRGGSPSRILTRSNSASGRTSSARQEIGVDFSAPCPSTRRSHTVRQGSSTSVVTNRSSMSMIFGAPSKGSMDASTRSQNGGVSVTSSIPSIATHSTIGKKELSNRTMQTTSTHTHTTSSTTFLMKDQSHTNTSDLSNSHAHQDHSACIGYVMDESHNLNAERRTSVDKKPVLPKTTKLPPRRSTSMTHESSQRWDALPKTSTATATTHESSEFPACHIPTWQDLANRKPPKKSKGWKKLFPRKSMTAVRR